MLIKRSFKVFFHMLIVDFPYKSFHIEPQKNDHIPKKKIKQKLILKRLFWPASCQEPVFSSCVNSSRPHSSKDYVFNFNFIWQWCNKVNATHLTNSGHYFKISGSFYFIKSLLGNTKWRIKAKKNLMQRVDPCSVNILSLYIITNALIFMQHLMLKVEVQLNIDWCFTGLQVRNVNTNRDVIKKKSL